MRPCGSISCQLLRPPPLLYPKSGGACGSIPDAVSDFAENLPKEEIEEVKYCFESLVGKWRDTTKKPSTYEVSVDHDSKVTIRTTRDDGLVLVTTGLVHRDKDSGYIIWGLPGPRQYWLSKLDSRSLKWRHQHLAAFVWHRVGECPMPPWRRCYGGATDCSRRRLVPPPLQRPPVDSGVLLKDPDAATTAAGGGATDCSRRRLAPPPLQRRDTESAEYVERHHLRVLRERRMEALVGHTVDPEPEELSLQARVFRLFGDL